MLYELQQGANEAKIIEQAQKLGMPLPEKIKNKPKLRIGLNLYWRAFLDCSSDREMGMAEGPLPWTSMNEWAIRYDIVGDEFDRLVLLLRAMDSVYLDTRNKTSKKNMDKAMRSRGMPTNSSSTEGPTHIKSRR